MAHVYRGEPIGRLLDHEFATGTVQSQSVDIHTVQRADEEALRLDERQPFFGTDIEDLPFETDKHTETFTPGFSPNLGTAMHFASYNWEEPGLVLHMDEATIPDLEAVDYSLDYMDRNPGILARVETLADGEVRWAGQVIGLVSDGSVNEWRPEMEQRATNPTYEDEAEMWSPVTNVDVERSTSAVAAYPIIDAPTKGTLNDMLSAYDGYTVGYGDGQKLEYMDTDEKAQRLREELQAQMPMFAEQLAVVCLESDRGLGTDKDDASVRDYFTLAATPDGVVRDPDHPALSYSGGNLLGSP